MQVLLGKIGSRTKKDRIKNILTDSDIFDVPDLTLTETYAPEKKIEYNEWFLIEKYSEHEYKNIIIDSYCDTFNYVKITEDVYSKLEYLCCINEEMFIFQKITTSSLIKRSWLGLFDDFKIEHDKPLLILGSHIDAVYDKKNDNLYFKELSIVSSMFSGIDELYREATENEVEIFLNSDFISLKNNFIASNVNLANRKRIAKAKDIFDKFTKKQKSQVSRYIKEYCPKLEFNSDSFSISNEKDLKALLYGIEQRYFKKPITKEKVVANSVEVLK